MKRKILLIDDDQDDAELFADALQEITINTTLDHYANGYDAINTLQQSRTELPHAIFVDINMPELTGWQCLAKIKQLDFLKDVPVIMYSTSSFGKLKYDPQAVGAT